MAVSLEVFGVHFAEIALRGAKGRPVVVGEVEAGDAVVEGVGHSGKAIVVVVSVAIVPPETEGNFGQLDARVATLAVVHHAVGVAVGICDVIHFSNI